MTALRKNTKFILERTFLLNVIMALLISVFSMFFLNGIDINSLGLIKLFFISLVNNLFIFMLLYLIFIPIKFINLDLYKYIQLSKFSFFSLFMATNYYIFLQFKFHINLFVIQVLFQPNIQSLLSLNWSQFFLAAIILTLGFIFAYFLWMLLGFLIQVKVFRKFYSKKVKIYSFIVILILFILEKILFSFQLYKGNVELYLASKRIPLYIITQMGKQFDAIGFKRESLNIENVPLKRINVNYPLEKIEFEAAQESYPNIIFLLSEKLRFDIINSEVTPKIKKFTDKYFTKYMNHYSVSNGTAQALFGMFYSLPSSYMDTFAKSKVSPIFLKLLQKRDYQFNLLSKADLGYFGTDEIIFHEIRDKIRDNFEKESEMIDEAIKILDDRKKSNSRQNPLFLFVFHDEPHQHNFDDPAYQKFKPSKYLPIFDPSNSEHRLIASNQFKNAYTKVDAGMSRLLYKLKEEGYFENSIIVITGDHGHEMYEKGHWGHASAFTKEQTHVSFFLHLPKQKKHRKVEKLTSHVDVVPTIIELMKENLPIEKFSIGESLIQPPDREYIILDGIANRVLFDGKVKIDYTPFEGVSIFNVTDENDNPITEKNLVLKKYKNSLLDMFNKLGIFYL